MIRNTVFSHSLSTPLKFISSDCGISSDKSSVISMPIENKTITPFNFTVSSGNEWTNKRAYFKSECGNIIIHFCSFINCYSGDEPGGSLWINQECTAVIHGTIFSGSHTKQSRGGACCIAKKVNTETEDPNDERISSLNIQYCCFSDCYPGNTNDTLYGLALFVAAEDAVFYFSSTINCPPKEKPYRSKGAQVDIQAENVKSKNINITGGRSKYCAGIEYRYATMGHFMFQTITQIEECMFATSLTKINISGLTLSFSNYDSNRLINSAEEKDKHLVPGLIHVRFEEIEINNFCFTNFIDDSNLKNSKIISRGTYYDKLENGTEINHEQKVMITLNNCYRDDSIKENQIGVKFVDGQQMLFGSVIYVEKLKTNNIPHLLLGHCEGGVAPDGEIIIEDVNEPSPSYAFTFSSNFSPSQDFSDSIAFTKSIEFTKSSDFNATDIFTSSNKFSGSDKFDATSEFTKSIEFSKSNVFKATDKFTSSNKFSKSDKFRSTHEFTKSLEFTKSNVFKATDKFTSSNKFSESDKFGATHEFTKSNVFKATEQFTSSNIFSKSEGFNATSQFDATKEFTKSNVFNQSSHFTSSHLFTGSEVFTKSKTFNPKSDVVIHIKQGDVDQKKSNVLKIAIGVSIAGVVTLAAITAFIILRRKKLTSAIFDDETITLTDDNSTSVYKKNPLLNLLDEDDPFEDEFK